MAEFLVINEPEEIQLQHTAPKSFIITQKEAATFGIIMPAGPGVDGADGAPGINGTNGTNGVDGTDGADGREVELQVSGGYIQWRYTGDISWTNLIALSALTGPAGADGLPGADGAPGTNGTNGVDGKSVEIQNNGTYIQWRLIGDVTWNNIVTLASLKGADGANGADGAPGTPGTNGTNGVDGTDGREIELNNDGTNIRWRYVGDVTWNNLASIASLTGPAGADGAPGTTTWAGITDKPGLPVIPKPISGSYLQAWHVLSTSATASTSGLVTFLRMDVNNLSVNGLGCYCSTAGVGGTYTVTLGLYNDIGDGSRPNITAGPIATTTITPTSTGNKYGTITTQTLNGTYWVAFLYYATAAPTTVPAFWCISNNVNNSPTATTGYSIGTVVRGFTLSGQTAMPTSGSTTPSGTTNIVNVVLRAT